MKMPRNLPQMTQLQTLQMMPPQMLHMILPRKDYEIVEDSGG